MAEIPKRKLTYAIFVGAVLVFVLTIFQTWAYGFKGSLRTPTPQYDNSLDSMCIHEPYFWFLVIVLLTAPLQKKLRISNAEYAIIYAMVSATIVMPNVHGILSNIFLVPGSIWIGDPVKKYVIEKASPLLGLKDPNLLEGLFFGGKPVPWIEWMPSLIYWILWGIMCYLFLLFISFIVAPVWIEKEDLPFPLVQPVTILVNEATTLPPESKVPKLLKNKLFWIGVVISIAADWGMYIPAWFDIGMVRFRNYYDLVPLAVLPWAVLVLYYQPVTVAFCYLWPTDILVSTLVLSIIVFLILPPLFTSIGFYAPMPTGLPWRDSWDNVFNGSPANTAGNPWYPGVGPMAAGTLLGIILWSIINHRVIYGEVIKKDRKLLACVIVTGLIWLMLHVIIGPEAPWLGAVLFGLTVYKLIGEGRVFAEMGGNFGCGWDGRGAACWNTTMFTVTWHDIAGLKPSQIGESSLFSLSMVAHNLDEWHWTIFNPMGQVLGAVKISSLMGIPRKEALKSIILAIVIAVVVMYPTYLVFAYMYGERKSWQPPFPPIYDVAGWASRRGTNAYNEVIAGTGLYRAYTGRPSAIPWMYAFFIAGVVITILLGFLRTRYNFFARYVSPICLWTTVFLGYYWLPMIIALILKQLITHIGGAKLHHEKVMPIITGIFFGWAIVTALVYGTNIIQMMPK
ncbi:MAG: DUF6785 family protein [Candidatus Bathyarchaeia archaeon]